MSKFGSLTQNEKDILLTALQDYLESVKETHSDDHSDVQDTLNLIEALNYGHSRQQHYPTRYQAT